MKGLDYQDKYEECCKKVEQIKIELGLPLESQTEDESQNSGGEDGGESSVCTWYYLFVCGACTQCCVLVG